MPIPSGYTSGQVVQAVPSLAGKILQVVQVTNATLTTISNNTYTSIGLSASITPSSSASKVLVFATIGAVLKSQNTYGQAKLLRGATDLGVLAGYIGYNNTTTDAGSSVSLTYLDSPATTSSTTYEVKFASGSNIASVQINSQATNTMTLMEISA